MGWQLLLLAIRHSKPSANACATMFEPQIPQERRFSSSSAEIISFPLFHQQYHIHSDIHTMLCHHQRITVSRNASKIVKQFLSANKQRKSVVGKPRNQSATCKLFDNTTYQFHEHRNKNMDPMANIIYWYMPTSTFYTKLHNNVKWSWSDRYNYLGVYIFVFWVLQSVPRPFPHNTLYQYVL